MTHPRTHTLPAGDAPAGRHALLDALPLEIAVLDAQGLILEVNAAWRNAAQIRPIRAGARRREPISWRCGNRRRRPWDPGVRRCWTAWPAC